MVLSSKVKGYAKKGYQVAFAKKSNAIAYKRELLKHGYSSQYLRSSGPTVDRNSRRTKAYYMIPKKVRLNAIKRRKR